MWKDPGGVPSKDKAEFYARLVKQQTGLLDGSRDRIANAANTSALLYQMLPRLNWAGFYFVDASGQALVLGPFQGKPACVRISLDQGVCGHAATTRKSVVVDDVHAFEGHIACDEASRSELVVPLLLGEQLIGVLDLDSPDKGRFDEADRVGCEAIAAVFVESIRAV